jgi:inosine-uridine nucleoside N-ribohydrolase
MKRSVWIALVLLSVLLVAALFHEAVVPGTIEHRKGGDRKRVIFDYDPGHFNEDDFALALALASPELEVVGVTVERSFAGAERIPLKMLHGIGRDDVPVALGRTFTPGIRQGLAVTGPGIPEGPKSEPPVGSLCQWAADYAETRVTEQSAPDLIAEKARDGRITIITTGPLTNPAEAISEHPEIARNIEEMIIMGGSIYRGYDGNNEPEPEWNIYSDVKSARTIFNSHIPIYLIPLDVTWDLKLWKNARDSIENASNPLTDMLWELYQTFIGSGWDEIALILFDPPVVACAIDRTVMDYRYLHINVADDGMTVIDQSGEPNAMVALWIDGDRFMDLFLDRLVRFGDR